MTSLQISSSNEPRSAAELIARYRDVKRRLYPPNTSVRILALPPAIKIPISVFMSGPEPAGKATDRNASTDLQEIEDQQDPIARFEAEIHGLNSRRSKARAKAALKMVAERTGFSAEEIIARCRLTPQVEARQEAIWAVKTATNWGLGLVGRFFDGRDHTTVHHAIRQLQKRAERNPELRAVMTEIERICATDTDCSKHESNLIGDRT